MQKKLFAAGSVLIILLGLFTGMVQARPSATCSGSGCNGVDPQGSGCSAITGQFTQKDGSAGSGTVQADLRYSSGCQSKWSRATNIYPGAIRKLSARLTDNTVSHLNVEPSFSSSIYAQLWTDMHNGSSTLCSIVQQGNVGGSYDAITNPACY